MLATIIILIVIILLLYKYKPNLEYVEESKILIIHYNGKQTRNRILFKV
jgi:hypothetical protein